MVLEKLRPRQFALRRQNETKGEQQEQETTGSVESGSF
jgi:hypothetical protein